MVAKAATLDLAAVENYAIAANAVGCPRDQLENFIRAGIVLQPKQLEASAMARQCDLPDGPTMLGFGGARGGGKALPLDALLATPSGWTTMGEVVEGDLVIGADGRPTKVIKVHELDCDPDAYEVVFSTGEVVKCDGRHLWVTESKAERVGQRRLTDEFRKKRRAKRPSRSTGNVGRTAQSAYLTERNQTKSHEYLVPSFGSVRSTNEIRQSLRVGKGEVNHSIKCCQPLDLPPASLEVEPYLLGLWLGDGASHQAYIGMLDQDLDEVLCHARADVEWRKPDVRNSPYSHVKVRGLLEGIVSLGLRDKKRIPLKYLRGSIDQRTALLQGIMDTDGHALANGQCEIGFSNEDLIKDTHELLSSLGIKATVKSKTARCNGKNCGPTWRIKFVADFPVFRLKRKVDRQKLHVSNRSRRRFIVDVRKTEPEPMRCITVEREDGTYLVGRSLIPTHNSFWAIAQCAADDCQRYPGLKVLILRRVGKSNEENFGALRKAVLHSLPHSFAAGKGLLVFPNGSEIQLGHFQRETDIDAYLGLEYDVIVVEEATTLSAAKIENIRTCNRTSKPGWRPRMYFTTNPGGESTAYFKETFVIPWKRGTETSTRYIPATVDDNQLVNKEYTDVLDTLTGWQYDAWRRGDWDAAAGQFFTTFREEDHVIPYEKLPKSFEAWGVLDYGFTHYTAFGLFRRDGDGKIILQREYGARKTLPEQHVASILKLLDEEGLELRDLERIVAGDDVWRTQRGGRSVAQDYQDHGIFFHKANTDRVDGAATLLRCLGNLYPSEDQILIEPVLQIMDGCKRTIEQLPAMVHDPGRPEDVLKVDCDEKGRGGDDFYDMCVGLDSLTLTRRGAVRICEVVRGDMVMTRRGWRPVTRSWLTRRNAAVVKVATQSGETLECTPDHPVHVAGKGWTRADMLRYGDILTGWQNQSRWSSTELFSGDTQTPRRRATEITTSQVGGTLKRASKLCMSRSGNLSTAKSHAVSTSITSTETALTTVSKIFSALQRRNTSAFTGLNGLREPSGCGQKARMQASSKKLGNGIDPLKAKSGIGSLMSPGSEPRRPGVQSSANNVAPNMRARQQRSSVPMPASPPIEDARGQTKWSLSARRAKPYLTRTNTAGLSFVPVRVLAVLDEGKTMDVWNLEVDGCHEFFAEGILVHNCRYGVMEGCRRKPVMVTTESDLSAHNAVVAPEPQNAQPQVQAGMFVFRPTRRG